MADINKAKENPLGQFWDELEGVTAVMLGSSDSHDHMQPMAPNVARDEGTIWFFTHVDTDIASKANGGTTHMCLINKSHDYHACASGSLSVQKSQEHIDRFWSPVTAAWFPKGKDDPDLTLLRFTPTSAEAWASTGSAVAFGWEIAKANLTGAEPDVGHKATISFQRG